MGKISIIVPVYNSENFLEKCIISILNQAYSNLEIILVNDGSTDNSLSICYRYKKIDDRVKVINKENGGVASARNEGLKIASGEFIGFVDSDDYIHPSMYYDMLRYAKSYNAEIVECGYFYVENDNVLYKKEFGEELINGNERICLNLIGHNNTTNSIWNKLYKKNVINDSLFSKYNYSEDLHFNSMVSYNCDRKYTLNKTYYYYNFSEESAMQSAFTNKHLDQIEAREDVFKFFQSKNGFEKVKKQVALDIIVTIVRLYIKVLRLNQDNKQTYYTYLIKVFNKYLDYVPENLITEIQAKRIKYSVILLRFSPNTFHILMKTIVRIMNRYSSYSKRFITKYIS